jgi:hypothetical protein
MSVLSRALQAAHMGTRWSVADGLGRWWSDAELLVNVSELMKRSK